MAEKPNIYEFNLGKSKTSLRVLASSFDNAKKEAIKQLEEWILDIRRMDEK